MPGGHGAALGAATASADSRDGEEQPTVSLYLEGNDLPNLDCRHTQGRSDPFCIVEMRDETDTSKFTTIGQTETVYNNLNPKWARNVVVSYNFGVAQVLRFRVYDRDTKGDDLSKQDYIGSATCTVAQVVLADNQRHTVQLSNEKRKTGQRCGKLVIRAEELKADLGESVTLQFACKALRNARKPFFVLCRETRDGAYAPVKYSEVHRDYHSGKSYVNKFKSFTVSLVQLCNAEYDRRLSLQFYDYDRKGKHYTCGVQYFTLNSLLKDFNAASSVRVAAGGKKHAATYQLSKVRSNGTKVNAGTLAVLACSVTSSVSFLDYITKGVVINTTFAIDMSSTNGNPADPASLHYNNPKGPNEYEAAIRQVGQVLSEYDSTRTFPAWGFSACLPPLYQEISQCFPLSDNPNAICTDVSGVMDSYRFKLSQVAPHQPCHYAPVLKKVIAQVKEEDKRSRHTVYTVLVLITDGAFDDFPAVADAICAAAELPLSIVIVGIGSAEMPLLEKLDGDDEKLCDSLGLPASRDIVQFVPFQKHRSNPAQLTKEVLDEIPDQLVSYYRSKGLSPKGVQSLGAESTGSSSVSASPMIPAPDDDVAALSEDVMSNFTLGGPASDTGTGSTISESNSNPNLAHEGSTASSAQSAYAAGGGGSAPLQARPPAPIYPSTTPPVVGAPHGQPPATHQPSYPNPQSAPSLGSYGQQSYRDPRSQRSAYGQQAAAQPHWTPALPAGPPPQQSFYRAPSGHAASQAAPTGRDDNNVYTGPVMTRFPTGSYPSSSTAAPPPPPVGGPVQFGPPGGVPQDGTSSSAHGRPLYARPSYMTGEAPAVAYPESLSTQASYGHPQPQQSYAQLQYSHSTFQGTPPPPPGPPPPGPPPAPGPPVPPTYAMQNSAAPLQYSAQPGSLHHQQSYYQGQVPAQGYGYAPTCAPPPNQHASQGAVAPPPGAAFPPPPPSGSVPPPPGYVPPPPDVGR